MRQMQPSARAGPARSPSLRCPEMIRGRALGRGSRRVQRLSVFASASGQQALQQSGIPTTPERQVSGWCVCWRFARPPRPSKHATDHHPQGTAASHPSCATTASMLRHACPSLVIVMQHARAAWPLHSTTLDRWCKQQQPSRAPGRQASPCSVRSCCCPSSEPQTWMTGEACYSSCKLNLS